MYRNINQNNQPINDENHQALDKTNTVTGKHHAQPTQRRSRTILGVIPDHELNLMHNQGYSQSQHQTHINHEPDSHNLRQQEIEYQIQLQQQNRKKIPVLVEHKQQYNENQNYNASSPTSTVEIQEQMETASCANQHDIDVDVDEGDIIAADNTSPLHEPLSPILTDSIREKIDHVYSRFSRDTLDPDDEDTYDVTMVAEYGNRIFNYLHLLETKYKPNPKYVEEVQEDLAWAHRSTLMDWLVQLHSRFNLLPETLYLSVNIIDRFLSKRRISLTRFQLCGAVSLFIAAKYEEINVPTVSQMVYMVGNQYSRDAFLKAERFMVEVLGFEFGWPGPMSFLRRGSKADDYDNEVRTLAKYFLEVTIMDARFVASPPSWLAAGAQYLSRRMLGRGEWTDAHIYYTGYTSEQLEPLALILEECCLSAEEHHKTIYQKYGEKRFKRASIYVQQYLKELYDFQQ
ncbi:hypothetical protein CANINC_003322 [Pichia inconspicua]|uniref:Uncharacterized protein n=1 Tax=Pichia inconspicua TaxID=52247 RepID=A0A4T0WZ19_9ASCO|nr:hypothetical protein CANINC_003322 [[Candida] inconspicua]